MKREGRERKAAKKIERDSGGVSGLGVRELHIRYVVGKWEDTREMAEERKESNENPRYKGKWRIHKGCSIALHCIPMVLGSKGMNE